MDMILNAGLVQRALINQRKHRGVALRSCHTGALFPRVTKEYGSDPISEEITAPLMTL